MPTQSSPLEQTVTRITDSDSHWATMSRAEAGDPDQPNPTFAILVSPGDDRQSAFVVEVTINSDNTGAICTISAFHDGEPTGVDVVDIGTSVLLTCPF